MKVATFNINGILRRMPNLLDWLRGAAPDVVCLQELKTDQDRFPHAALRDAGYASVWVAEGAYNGVAILVRDEEPIVTRRALPGAPSDMQPRYIEAAVSGVLVACLYAPNGNPQPGPRFEYKLGWMQRLHEHARAMSEAKIPVVLAGDFNVVPTDRDMYASKSSWKNDALVQPAPRAAYARLLELGYTDSLRARRPEATDQDYTFWDYKRDGWKRGHGLRIDHILLAPALSGRLLAAGVDREIRGLDGASDHAPMWVELEDA